MAGNRNTPQVVSTRLAWDQDGVASDKTDTHIYSPSWEQKSPWLGGMLNFIKNGSDSGLTSINITFQASSDWDGDDATAKWFSLLPPTETHNVRQDAPDFVNIGTNGLFRPWIDAAFTASFDDFAALSAGTVAQVVPIIGGRIRIAAYVTGTLASATPTTWTIHITEARP
jgi:hypothetical protein